LSNRADFVRALLFESRRDKWERIKQQDPALAKFILELKKVFGKLGSVEHLVSRETYDKK